MRILFWATTVESYKDLGSDQEFRDGKHKLLRLGASVLGACQIELLRVEEARFADLAQPIKGFDHVWEWISVTFNPNGKQQGTGLDS